MLLQLIVSGAALGSIYALLGLALVLIHKATDVVNFAQGELAMLLTFVAFVLATKVGVPLPVLFLLALPLGGLLGALLQRFVIRPTSSGPRVNALIVTIGLWIVVHHTAGWIWGYDPYRFPSLFSSEPVEIAGARLSPNSLGVLGVSLLVMGALYVFFEYTREGTAMRASSMNPVAAQLMGIRVQRVALVAWALAGAISMICGMLVAPLTFLDFEMMVAVLLSAFAGAVLGGFNSLPGTVLGCLLIGLIQNLLGAYVSSAFKEAAAFLIIVAVLMFRPQGLFTRAVVKKV
jgi:branched-chain amino acid transport system permease protein